MVNVLATGPKVREFKPGRGDGFLTAIKISSMPAFGEEMKRKDTCRKISQHVKNHFQV
jgi:hypothetical protein